MSNWNDSTQHLQHFVYFTPCRNGLSYWLSVFISLFGTRKVGLPSRFYSGKCFITINISNARESFGVLSFCRRACFSLCVRNLKGHQSPRKCRALVLQQGHLVGPGVTLRIRNVHENYQQSRSKANSNSTLSLHTRLSARVLVGVRV